MSPSAPPRGAGATLSWPQRLRDLLPTATGSADPVRPYDREPAGAVSGLCFVLIQLQGHTARWSPGTLGLIMDGTGPAKVPNNVIAEIRRREVGGIPYATEQGIFKCVSGKVFQGTGNFHLRTRERI